MTSRLKIVQGASRGTAPENKKSFIFATRVYLSDTNAQGGVYFARYFDWQGTAREEFFRVAVPIHETFFSAGYQLLTVEAGIEYKGEAKLYDEIEIEVAVNWIKRASAELRFTFSNNRTGRVIAVGRQVIACADQKGKVVAAPEGIKALLSPYVR